MAPGTLQQLAPTDRGRVWIVFEAIGVIVGLFAVLVVLLGVFDEPSQRVNPGELPPGTPYTVSETSAGLRASIDCPSLWQTTTGDGDPLCAGATRGSLIGIAVAGAFILGCTTLCIAARRQRLGVRARTARAPLPTWSYEQHERPLGVDFILFVLGATGLVLLLMWWSGGTIFPLAVGLAAGIAWRTTGRRPEGRATELTLTDAYTLASTTPEGTQPMPVRALERIEVRRRRRPRLGPRVQATFTFEGGTTVETIAVDEHELRALMAFVSTLHHLEPDVVVDVVGEGTRRWPTPEPGRNPRRPLAADERAVIEAMLGPEVPEREVLADQLGGLRARDLDDGSLELRVRKHAPALTAARALISYAVTEDVDGATIEVELLLTAGYLAELMVWRQDGEPVRSALDPTKLDLRWATWWD
jgi:hypothetical protein